MNWLRRQFPPKSYRQQAQDAAIYRSLIWLGVLLGLML